MPGETFTAGCPDGGAQRLVVGSGGDDIDDDGLAGERVGFSAYTTIGDAWDGEDDRFYLGGHELLAADIDHLAEPAEDAQRASWSLLDLVAGAEPAVAVKRSLLALR